MRTSEWIQAGFATIFAVAAWISPLTARRRWTVTLLATFVIVAIVLARLSEHILEPKQASILRDWLPVALMLVPYWQTGQFFLGPKEKIQDWLLKSDRWLLNVASGTSWRFGRVRFLSCCIPKPEPSSRRDQQGVATRLNPQVRHSYSGIALARLSMEWAYMLCYPLVPLGLATLCAAGLRRNADTFWFLVLVPTYLCYAITPFVPALPPRSVGSTSSGSSSTKSRVFNLWILKHGSIHAISLPSAHVASALAVSLVILNYLPLAGLLFLAITFWIAVAAVVGRYHYAIDVVLGAAMTLAVYFAWRAHLIPSTLITAPAITLAAPL